MSYRIKEDTREQAEIREIGPGEYFEFQGDVFQRYHVSSNFTVKIKAKDEDYPIYALNLSENTIVFFGNSSETKVTRLYEVAPVILTRGEP